MKTPVGMLFHRKLVILSKYIIFHEDGSNRTALQWKN